MPQCYNNQDKKIVNMPNIAQCPEVTLSISYLWAKWHRVQILFPMS